MCFVCPHCGASIQAHDAGVSADMPSTITNQSAVQTRYSNPNLAAEELSGSNAADSKQRRKQAEPRRAHDRKEALNVVPEEVVPREASISFFEPKPGLPNEHEVLFFTLLALWEHRGKVAGLNLWTKEVLVEAESFREQGSAWVMPEAWQSKGSMVPYIFKPLSDAYDVCVWEETMLEQISKAMQAWEGPGHISRLNAGRLKSHRAAKVKGPGPKKAPKSGPPRWKTAAAVIGVAGLIKDYGIELRRLLKLDVPLEDVPTVEMKLEEARDRVVELEERMKPLVLIADAHRKMKAYYKEKNPSVTAARRDERAKLKENQKTAQKVFRQKLVVEMRQKLNASKAAVAESEKARLDAQYASRFEAQRTGLNVARSKARAAVQEAGKEQRKLRKVEKDAAEAAREREASEDGSDEIEDDPTRRLPFELLPRRDDRGRFQAEAPEIHALRLEQLARGGMPSMVSQNIQGVINLIAPGVEIPATCESQNRSLRGEVTLCGEGMAAWKFASAKRILFVGWDESTKFGDAVFSLNCQVEYFDGSREDVCLRGLTILPAGGTSKAILEHIETQIFAYSRRILTLWKEAYEADHGAGSWQAAGGPSPENIGLHRLCEDTVLMTDTCNGARCTKRMLAEAIMETIKEKIGIEAWNAMDADERNQKYRIIRGDCWQHLRNIIIDAMANTAAEMVQEAVADSLELFSSFERIQVDSSSNIISSFKQFHHGGEYCKGRGREFKVYHQTKHPSALVLSFERAVGNRQDLKFDGCKPLFWNRPLILEFQRGYIDVPKSENVLDKSIYTTMRCNEFVAELRANTLWGYVFSDPFRWLCGKIGKLAGLTVVKMSEVLDHVEAAFERVSEEPSSVLDPQFDMFTQITTEIPEFKEWRAEVMDRKVVAADGKTEHFIDREVLREARAPTPGSGNEQATPMTLRLLKAQADRALSKLHDKKLALADKLSSQGGKNAFSKNGEAHAVLEGVHGTNDTVENKFAIADRAMRNSRHISTLNVSGIIQQRSAHDWERPLLIVSDRRKRKAAADDAPPQQRSSGGFFWTVLDQLLRNALIKMARKELPNAQRENRSQCEQHNAEKLSRREEALQKQLYAAVEKYAAALELFDQWKAQGVKDAKELDAALDGMSETEQIAELRRQIEMRTVGCGWREFETKWGFYADEKKHTIANYRKMLVEDILPHERGLRRLHQLPTRAVPPATSTRIIKSLGTLDADAQRIEAQSVFQVDNLLAKAEAARADREVRGISDSVEAAQPRKPPKFDVNLVGKILEICWPYRLNGKTMKIWASGTVKRVADGLTNTASARAKKILPAGALLWAWEADPERNEPAGEKWLILAPGKWNRHVQYAWRYDPCELVPAGQPRSPPRAPVVDTCATDDEYITDYEDA